MDALCVVNPFKGGTENEQYSHGKVHTPLETCGLLNYNCQYSTLREQHLLRFLLTFNVFFQVLPNITVFIIDLNELLKTILHIRPTDMN